MIRHVAIALSLAFATPVLAQEDPVLPDLAPREVEIMGDLTISFPSLRRQPLVGFNPPPRISDIPDSRRPFAQPYLQDRADLPRSPLADPTAPAVSRYDGGPRFTGSAEAGAGFYLQRYTALDVSSTSASRTQWGVEARYDGRSGYEPQTAAPGADASYDAGRLAARIRVPMGAWSVSGRVEGQMQSYVLFAAVPTSGSLANAGPDRRARWGGASLAIARERGTARLRFDAALRAARVETGVFDRSVRVDPRSVRSDAGVDAGLRFDSGPIGLGGRWSGTALPGSSVSSPDVASWIAAAGYRHETDNGTRITAGIALLGFQASAAATGAARRVFTWVTPDVTLEAAPAANLRLVARNTPHAGPATLQEIYAVNPYAEDAPSIEPELWPVDASAAGTAALGRLEVSLTASLRQSPNRRYFEHSTTTFASFARGMTAVRHGKAREIGLGLEMSTYLGESTRARMGASIRNGRLLDLDVTIPHFASWTAHAMLSTSFAGSRALVQVIGRMEGARPRDTAGSLELQPFADIDIISSYRISRSASAVLRLENLAGNRPEWDAYLRPSPLVTAGLLWQW